MASTKQSKRQEATWKRIQGIDPEATKRVVEGQTFVTYVPKWELGRMVNGQFRSNPNPQKITMYVHEDGKLYGFGFGNEAKPPVALVEAITQASDMAEALKARVASRRPEKVEPEATPEPEAEVKPKAAAAKKTAAKKTTTRQRSGVQVSK
jgi:hypothetical protein